MNKPISAKERSFLRIVAKSGNRLEDEILEDEVRSLFKIKRKAGQETENWFTQEFGRLRFGPFCGVIHTNEVKIQLLPKIEVDLDDSCRILVKLLKKSGFIKFSKLGEEITGRNKQSVYLLDIFIQDFCEQIERTLLHGAIFRYEEQQDNLGLVRGRIAFTENLRVNAFDKSRLLCRFDERTVDNTFNRILKFTLNELLKLASNVTTKMTITKVLFYFDRVSDQKIQITEFKKLTFDRTNQQWKDIFDQAERLLAMHFPDLKIPKKPRINDAYGSSILFNMERVFERVIARRIQFHQIDYRFDVKIQNQEKFLATNENETKKFFRLRPDIIIFDRSQDNDKPLAILDTKWKDLDLNDSKTGVSSQDAYQMNAYAQIHRCNHLILIYPAANEQETETIRTFKFSTKRKRKPTLHVIRVSLRHLANEIEMPKKLHEVIDHIRKSH